MDSQKVKAVLVRAENIICCDCEPEKRIPCIKYPECTSIRDVREVINELEEPASEDARIVAKLIAMEHDVDFDKDSKCIQQYAESFATKKCAESAEQARKEAAERAVDYVRDTYSGLGQYKVYMTQLKAIITNTI